MLYIQSAPLWQRYVAALTMVLGISALSVAAEDLPSPATVHLVSGPAQTEVYLIREGFNEVAWSRDDRGQARTTRATDEIERVEYTPIPGSERSYVRSLGAYNARNWANAIDGFAETAASSRYAFYRIDAHLKRAEALMRLRRYEDALADTQAVITKYADWVYVVDAMAMEGQIHSSAGNSEQAIQAYQRLRQEAAKFGPKYGPMAISRGALGEANLLLADDKPQAAIPLLQQALSAVPLSKAPIEHGKVAVVLGDALIATGAVAEARALFEGLRFANVSPANRAKAFLELGKMSEADGDKIAAVDALLTAAVLRGSDDAVRAEARRRARSLLTELGSDSSLNPEIQREYRAYGSRL